MYYIQESDKLNKIKEFFNIVKLENNYIILPVESSKEINERQAYKLAVKTKQILSKTNSKKLV